jgi:isopenicillin-N epimerase
MTAFRLPTGTPQTLQRRLWERYRIEAPVIEKPDRIMIRVSTHFYTTEREVDRLVDALRTELA